MSVFANSASSPVTGNQQVEDTFLNGGADGDRFEVK